MWKFNYVRMMGVMEKAMRKNVSSISISLSLLISFGLNSQIFKSTSQFRRKTPFWLFSTECNLITFLVKRFTFRFFPFIFRELCNQNGFYSNLHLSLRRNNKYWPLLYSLFFLLTAIVKWSSNAYNIKTTEIEMIPMNTQTK